MPVNMSKFRQGGFEKGSSEMVLVILSWMDVGGGKMVVDGRGWAERTVCLIALIHVLRSLVAGAGRRRGSHRRELAAGP